MATEAGKFKVGLFLIAGFLLLNGALIWIGAARLLEEKRGYTTYFSESVQGLDVGSAVKYRGVPLGHVTGIHVAPGGLLVEVRMNIDPTFQLPDSSSPAPDSTSPAPDGSSAFPAPAPQ